MPNKRDLRLEKYGISKKRYKELCGFCEQYPEWKLKISNCLSVSGISYSNTPRSKTNAINHPTEDAAIKMERYMSNCKLIEEVAQKVAPNDWKHLIAGICGGKSVTWLIAVDGMNMSKSVFYDLRKKFFFLLDKEKI